MSETFKFKLPLLQAAQAQKHVTVNEALVRLDAAAQMRLVTISNPVPPMAALEGEAYGVPVGAVNAWDGHIGEIAVAANGGWVFLKPAVGWSAWIESQSYQAVFDGADWRPRVVAMTASGASTAQHLIEFDHVITPGTTNLTSVNIEASMLVFGITGRVVSPITGTAVTGWRVGVATSDNRYANGLGLGLNTWFRGQSGSPLTYWNPEPLLLTAEGGAFGGGTVRIVIHGLVLQYPGAV